MLSNSVPTNTSFFPRTLASRQPVPLKRGRHRAGSPAHCGDQALKPGGRPISAVIAELKARGSTAVIDDEFTRDVEAGIEACRQPWTPASWE